MTQQGSTGGEPALVAIDDVGGFHAVINPLGAELWRLQDGSGRDLLWDGDPAFWTGRAPVLFPIIGELHGGSYRYRGVEYRLPRHGFARRKPWRLRAHEASSATFRLEADAETRAVYPFGFALDMAFAVGPAALTVTATVTNTGDDVMPFSLGHHPALRWPFEPGARRDDYRLRFDRDEPEDIGRLDGQGLLARREPSPVRGRELPLADALFADDAIVFGDPRSRAVDFGRTGSEQLRVSFPAFAELGVWTKPGAGYLCIEPWLGHADPAGFEGEIFAKPGICTLQPGHDWQAVMTIALQAAEA